MEVPVLVPGTLLLIQLPQNVAVNAADNGPSIWTPTTYMEGLDGVPGFRLNSYLTVAVTGGLK